MTGSAKVTCERVSQKQCLLVDKQPKLFSEVTASTSRISGPSIREQTPTLGGLISLGEPLSRPLLLKIGYTVNGCSAFHKESLIFAFIKKKKYLPIYDPTFKHLIL